jgi:GTP-binding protein
MRKPSVAIVGRPNVGKSTLFNRMVGRRAAIVDDIPGVTRDLNYMDAVWEDREFIAVDTGGFFPGEDDNILTQIKEQALFAIDEADIIIHLLDGKEGLNPHDTELAGLLRASGKKVLWAVNKIDAETRDFRLYDFYSLGQDVMPVSAATGFNFDVLMDRAASMLPLVRHVEVDYPRVAVIGRPNTGKSTLVNSLLGKKRMIVSPVPGTTRDAVDSVCTYYKRKYMLIDTAGIRRKQARGYSIERFAMLRTLRSIERADVAVVLMDAQDGIVAEDQKILGLVHSQGKGAVIVFNKWDLVEDPEKAYKTLTSAIEGKLWFFKHAPVLTTSALERKRVTKIFSLVDGVIAERKKRIGTAELNKLVGTLRIPPYRGKKVNIYYATQFGTDPPSFAIFTNRPEGIKDSHMRHIEGRLRDAYSFRGTPIRIFKKLRK